MSQKRQQDDDGCAKEKERLKGNNTPEDKRRRLPAFRNVVLEVMKRENFQHLESMIRKVVKEEVESVLKNHVKSLKRTCVKDLLPSESRSLRLKFISTLSLPVFTGTQIEGEDGSPIKVALTDAVTDEVVQFDPLSSSKVEIVVVEGDFDGNERESWTKEEFENNIIKEREGKKPLLTGNLYLFLKEGSGVMGDISFTDNSSWTRSRRFRLGARLAGNLCELKVREALTTSFVVRDHRGELYKKHYPPRLLDEVWRLEKIGKEGAFHKRLCMENIRSVKDFLIMLNLEPAQLRSILGSGMSTKMWEVTVEHARTCRVDEVYSYYAPGSQPRKGVVFTAVAEVVGLLVNSQCTQADELSETEKIEAQKLVISAFQNWEEVTPYAGQGSSISRSHMTPSTSITQSPEPETPDCRRLLPSDNISILNYAELSISSPDVVTSYSMGSMMADSDNYWVQAMEGLHQNEPPLSIPAHMPRSPFISTEFLVSSFCDDEQFGLFDTEYHPLQSQNSNVGYQSNLFCGILPLASTAKAIKGGHRRWRLVFSVLQWFFLLRGVVGKRSQGDEMQRFY